MNLPNYLAPATPFDYEKHGYDFPLRVKTFSEGGGWRAECRCGEVGRITQAEAQISTDGFWPWNKWMAAHVEAEERAHAIRSKWGAATPPINGPTEIAVSDGIKTVEGTIVARVPAGLDKPETVI